MLKLQFLVLNNCGRYIFGYRTIAGCKIHLLPSSFFLFSSSIACNWTDRITAVVVRVGKNCRREKMFPMIIRRHPPVSKYCYHFGEIIRPFKSFGVFFYPLLHIHVCVLSCFLQVGSVVALVCERAEARRFYLCVWPSKPAISPPPTLEPSIRAPHPTSQQPGAPSPSLSHLAPSFPPLSSSQWLHCSVPARAWPTLPVSLCHHVFD